MWIEARVTRTGTVVPAFQIDRRFAREVMRHSWCNGTGGYLIAWIDGKVVKLHRFVWRLAHGEYPTQVTDHINRDKLDNRLANLRDVSIAENNSNRTICRAGEAKRKKSGLPTGVIRNRRHDRPNAKPFKASIRIGRARKCLGFFDSPEEASARYQQEVSRIRSMVG